MFKFLSVFNIAKVARVHGIVRNANGTFMRLRYVENGEIINIVGRTGVRKAGVPQPMFASPYTINFYRVRHGTWHSVRADRVLLMATVGRKEVVQGSKPHA